MASTVADYHRFCRMLLNGGALDGEQIISPKTLELMIANHLPGGGDLTQHSKSLFSEAEMAGIGFGLGFALQYRPCRDTGAGVEGRIFLGRHVLDRLLCRSGRGSDHDLHDPVEPFIALIPSAVKLRTMHLFGACRLTLNWRLEMQSVTTRKDGEILIITVNNPPVNVLSWHVRKGLSDGINGSARR